MKKHVLLFLTLFFITIGFATVNTVLDVKGNINVSENLEDFKIEITSLKINNEEQKLLISNDKQSFTFLGSGNDILEYEVTNYSYQYDSTINLVCDPNENINIEQVGELVAQSKETKSITSTSTYEITCRIDVEKISRTEYAEDMCPYKNGDVFTFDYTGAEQEFEIKCDGEYLLEVWGAAGGDNTGTDGFISGGKGGYSKGTTILSDGTILNIVVGGGGNSLTGFDKIVVVGNGYNGGGGLSRQTYVANSSGSGGGGATHIAKVKGILSSIGYESFVNQGNGLIIAGGGGGSAVGNSLVNHSGSGGAGGGLNGLTGTPSIVHPNSKAVGGSQTAGGVNAYRPRESAPASFGQGCIAMPVTDTDPYKGHMNISGGAGLYGGACGVHGGGGGGSSYIGGVSNGLTIAGNASMPTHDGASTMTGNSGNGYAKITYLGDNN